MVGSIGFMGVGHLADYTSRGRRRGGYAGKLYLSPRNAERAETLRRDCAGEILDSNQAVADAADILFLSVRPAFAEEVLREITLAPGQILVSACYGIPISQLQVLQPDAQIYRAMPVTSAAVAESPTLICPRHEQIEALFDRAGLSVGVDSEEEFEAGAVLATVYGWFFALFDELRKETEAAGVSPEAARKLVAGMARGAATVALDDLDKPLEETTWEIATEGTFTRLGLEHLLAADAFTPWREAFLKVRDAG